MITAMINTSGFTKGQTQYARHNSSDRDRAEPYYCTCHSCKAYRLSRPGLAAEVDGKLETARRHTQYNRAARSAHIAKGEQP